MSASKEAAPLRVEWACPKCGAKANEHGKGGAGRCRDTLDDSAQACRGFLCQCEDAGIDDADTAAEDHGCTFANPCTNAVCYHCEFGMENGGRFPVRPKGLQAWEQKALDAGWAPPAKRAAELATKRRAT